MDTPFACDYKAEFTVLEYYNILTSKLENCHNSWSGYKLASDTPYAYPDLKNTLYG